MFVPAYLLSTFTDFDDPFFYPKKGDVPAIPRLDCINIDLIFCQFWLIIKTIVT